MQPRDEPDPKSRDFWRLPIASAITLTFGGLLSVAVLAVGFVTWRANQQNTLELMGGTAELYLDSLAGLTQEHQEDGHFQVEHLARLVRTGALDLDNETELKAVLAGSLAAGPQVHGVALVQADGTATRVGFVEDELVYLRSNWAGRPDIDDLLETARSGTLADNHFVVWAEDLGAPHVSTSVPLFGPDGSFQGAASAVVAITEISEFVASLASEGARTFVLLGHDRVVAHADMASVATELSPERPLPRASDLGDEVLAAMWDEPVMDRALQQIVFARNAKAHAVEVAGNRHLFVYREAGTIGGEPMTVGVYLPLDEVIQPLHRLIGSGTVALVILLVSIGLSVLLGRALARPVRRLEAAAEAVARLKLDEMPPLERSRLRELDAAQRTFAAMRTALGWFEIYVPRALVARLMQLGPSATHSEERQITVLFTDISGFTKLAERRSPEELATLLNEHFALLGTCVEAESGTVDKYIGDSLMAFWGAPESQPDHAARALRAAREMARAVAQDNRQRQANGQPAVRLRIGLHSGPAVVGNIGAPSRMNYTLIGDTVNVAQRLEALGKERGHPGEDADVILLASADTLSAADAMEAGENLGKLDLRGREDPVEVYRVTVACAKRPGNFADSEPA
ncbi:adenylate/guanylate cyclase domain-containing protein [Algihabitans albus]|uniref:adenylate/guanylate cyclase domain-containing protein n=1 Tax=Algihabitans albus TaxID=2164067 RepID=UPI000E5CC1BE|nr:adenylate/guanylate cyclase domain-containing protein [Algihabitans albus]